ncbi:hypothetical protein ACFL54_09650 [Planctomycetota bacterium]
MKRIALALMLLAALTFMIVGCGGKRSSSGIEILNIEFFGEGKPTIRLIDPDEGFRTVHIGDKVNGLQVLEADSDGVTFLGINGERIYVKNKN